MEPLKDASHLHEVAIRIFLQPNLVLQGVGEYDFVPLIAERTAAARD